MPFKGKRHTPETRARISQSLLGNKNFPETYERVCESCTSTFDARTSNGKWCKTCAPDNTFRARLHNYGVSKPMWDKILAAQSGTCALCTNEPTMVDHDHKTEVVRGLLCRACNIALGRAEMSDWIFRVSSYLLRGKN